LRNEDRRADKSILVRLKRTMGMLVLGWFKAFLFSRRPVGGACFVFRRNSIHSSCNKKAAAFRDSIEKRAVARL
jgi:hypothetical protein